MPDLTVNLTANKFNCSHAEKEEEDREKKKREKYSASIGTESTVHQSHSDPSKSYPPTDDMILHFPSPSFILPLPFFFFWGLIKRA
jgi:hypothetical protein